MQWLCGCGGHATALVVFGLKHPPWAAAVASDSSGVAKGANGFVPCVDGSGPQVAVGSVELKGSMTNWMYTGHLPVLLGGSPSGVATNAQR